MRPIESDTALDNALKQLPPPRAPRTLLPRVMAAVQVWARRPWYQRAWFTWPVAAQAALVVALVGCASGGVLLFSTAEAAGVIATPSFVAQFMSRAAVLAQSAEMTTNAVRVVCRALLQPFVPYASLLVVLMSLACAAFGAALNRVAFGRTFQL